MGSPLDIGSTHWSVAAGPRVSGRRCLRLRLE